MLLLCSWSTSRVRRFSSAFGNDPSQWVSWALRACARPAAFIALLFCFCWLLPQRWLASICSSLKVLEPWSGLLSDPCAFARSYACKFSGASTRGHESHWYSQDRLQWFVVHLSFSCWYPRCSSLQPWFVQVFSANIGSQWADNVFLTFSISSSLSLASTALWMLSYFSRTFLNVPLTSFFSSSPNSHDGITLLGSSRVLLGTKVFPPTLSSSLENHKSLTQISNVWI